MKRNLIITIYAALISIVCLSSCVSGGHKIKVGKMATISNDCYGAADEQVLKELIECSTNKDTLMFNYILKSYDVSRLKKGMAVKVKSIRIGIVKVKLLTGKEVWVMYKHLE